MDTPLADAPATPPTPLATPLQHPWWSEPEMSTRWQVQCFDGHNRPVSSPVWVAARTAERAVRAGKYWMRVVGIKRRGTVVARRYHPQHDPAFRGYIRIESAAGSAA